MEKTHPICSNQLAFLSYELSNTSLIILFNLAPSHSVNFNGVGDCMVLAWLVNGGTETQFFYSCSSVT